jgi:hypothetical protein
MLTTSGYRRRASGTLWVPRLQTRGLSARKDRKTEARDADVEPGSLVELIARIQSKPSDPANIRPGNMVLLAERLANPVTEPDPSFDPIVWDRQWAQIEAEMVS